MSINQKNLRLLFYQTWRILILLVFPSLSNIATLKPWYSENDTEENNNKSRRAYEALLTVTPYIPETEEYLNFSNQVKKIALEEFNYTIAEEPVNPFVAAFHEAVLLYATALNETLEQCGSISNGSAITSRMWGRTFSGNQNINVGNCLA